MFYETSQMMPSKVSVIDGDLSMKFLQWLAAVTS